MDVVVDDPPKWSERHPHLHGLVLVAGSVAVMAAAIGVALWISAAATPNDGSKPKGEWQRLLMDEIPKGIVEIVGMVAAAGLFVGLYLMVFGDRGTAKKDESPDEIIASLNAGRATSATSSDRSVDGSSADAP